MLASFRMSSERSRPASAEEIAVVRWLLANAVAAEVASYRDKALGDLHVAGGCDCGCASVDFQPNVTGAKVIADAAAVYPDGQQAGVILWGREGEIVALEFCDGDPGASHRMPSIENLRRWEHLHGEEAKP
jgi:hypothetical protein